MMKMLQLLCYNFFMIKIADKHWQIMLWCYMQNHSVIAKFKIIKGVKGFKKSEITFLREICHGDADLQKDSFTDDFQNRCYKLINFEILEPFPHKVAGLFEQNTYGGCFCLFVAANNFLQLNMVFIADSRTNFWKQELKLRSSP